MNQKQSQSHRNLPLSQSVSRFVVPAIALVSLFATGGATGGSVTPVPHVESPMQSPVESSMAIATIAPVELLHDAADDVEMETMSDASDNAATLVSTPSHLRTIEMEVTAYCACTKCCGPDAIGLTASGRDVSYNNGRFVAADTTVLPFNTRIVVPGYNSDIPVEVIDRGGAIKGNRLDVYFPTHEEAMIWGRQTLTVTIQD